MSQNSSFVKSYFYLVNLFHEPVKESFKVEVLDKDKKVLKELNCYTNTINLFEISKYFMIMTCLFLNQLIMEEYQFTFNLQMITSSCL